MNHTIRMNIYLTRVVTDGIIFLREKSKYFKDIIKV